MKLGVFDSGIGGLVIAQSIRKAIPDIDMVYLGDTLHVPYGARSTEAIYQHSLSAIKFLFEREDCQLIIIACNTASANALRQLQQGYLAENYPDRRILGVIAPTLEVLANAAYSRLGVLATRYIVQSNIYKQELQKINPYIEIFQQASPLLVPLIENDGQPWIRSVLESYLVPLIDMGIDGVLLGCTHYPVLKDIVRDIVGEDISVVSQDDIIPKKLEEYLIRHPQIDSLIGRGGGMRYYLSDVTESYQNASMRIWGKEIEFMKAVLQ